MFIELCSLNIYLSPDEGRSPIPLSEVLEFHKVDASVKMSHINVDPLKDVTDPAELHRRWRRFCAKLALIS